MSIIVNGKNHDNQKTLPDRFGGIDRRQGSHRPKPSRKHSMKWLENKVAEFAVKAMRLWWFI
jgi:hypothetical protein